MPDSLSPIVHLLQIMARLRDKEQGCPWDVAQNFSSIAPYAIEEAYEVADAIAREDMQSLKEELGDLLLQVVFHAQMASEAGLFDFDAVVTAIANKMTHRHPHVFGDGALHDADAVTTQWENIKQQERAQKQAEGILDDVPLALPALLRAEKLQKRAARVGFDWPEVSPVFEKLLEELEEVREVIDHGSLDRKQEEIGDLLFVATNLARHAKVDPEAALRQANAKFERRFRHIETMLRNAGKDWASTSLEEMDALWNDAKRIEKKDAA